jgi:hypothetical protein
VPNVLAGVNLAREEAYRHMVARGFRDPGCDDASAERAGLQPAGVYIFDDWR